MARKVIVSLVDDLDGTSEADETVTFGIELRDTFDQWARSWVMFTVIPTSPPAETPVSDTSPDHPPTASSPAVVFLRFG